MNGASKLNEKEVDKILDMVSLGFNDAQIHRMYKTPKNETISREHIRSIRIGKRWNAQSRSFIHKQELQATPIMITDFQGNILKTELAILMLKSGTHYVVLTMLDDELIDATLTELNQVKPTDQDLIDYHLKAINEYQRKNKDY